MTKNKLLRDLVWNLFLRHNNHFTCVGRRLLNKKVRVANWRRLNSSWKT